MTKKIPDEIIVLYVAFLKNYDRVTKALADYYGDPMGITRTRLLQELSRPLKYKMSTCVIMAEKAMPILDHYNTIATIWLDEEWKDIDFNDAELLTVLASAGVGVK